MVFGSLGLGLGAGDDVWVGLPTGNLRVDLGALVTAMTGQGFTIPGRGDDGDGPEVPGGEIDVNEPPSGGGGGNHAADCMKLCLEAMMLSGGGVVAGTLAWKFGTGAGWGAASGLVGGGAWGGLLAGAAVAGLVLGAVILLLSGLALLLECQRRCGVDQLTDSMLPPGRRR